MMDSQTIERLHWEEKSLRHELFLARQRRMESERKQHQARMRHAVHELQVGLRIAAHAAQTAAVSASAIIRLWLDTAV